MGKPLGHTGWRPPTSVRASAMMLVGCVGLAVLASECARRRPVTAVADLGPGKRGFQAYCAACHVSNGPGIPAEAPPLEGSQWVTGPEDRLIKIVLEGLRGPIEVNGKTYNQEMPAVGKALADEQVASVLSFVRGLSGGSKPVLTADVNRVRAATRDRTAYWTVEDLR
jgi:mono/diheme cytochrome c family protein